MTYLTVVSLIGERDEIDGSYTGFAVRFLSRQPVLESAINGIINQHQNYWVESVNTTIYDPTDRPF